MDKKNEFDPIGSALQRIAFVMENRLELDLKKNKKEDRMFFEIAPLIKRHLEALEKNDQKKINEIDCGRCVHAEEKVMGCYCVLHHLALVESVDDCNDFLIRSEEFRK